MIENKELCKLRDAGNKEMCTQFKSQLSLVNYFDP